MNEETLTINDLLQIQKIIDVAVQRGAFKADETRIVGETYEKITKFLESIQPAEEEDTETLTEDKSTDNEKSEEKSQDD